MSIPCTSCSSSSSKQVEILAQLQETHKQNAPPPPSATQELPRLPPLDPTRALDVYA